MKREPLPETNEAGRGNQTTAPPKRQPLEEIHPKPPKQTGPGLSTRASKRPDTVEEVEMQKMAQEIKSLARQVAALRELVQQCINGERSANRKSATHQETHSAKDREMREECSRAEGRGVLLAKSSTLRLAASARAEEASHPKTADTWAKVVGRKGKEAARRKAKQEAQQKAPPREQQPRKQQFVPKGKRKGVGISVKPPRRAAVSLTVAEEVANGAKTHWPEARYASKI